jgi:hypothetical protein
MSMRPKLFSIGGAAIELGKDRRTIARRLARVQPDGRTADGGDGWYLSTILAQLDQARDGGDGPALDALEDASAAVDDLLNALRGESNIKKRRELLKRDGGVIGAYTTALDRVRAGQSDSTRLVTGPYLDQIIGNAIAEVLALCDLKLEAA